MNRLNKLTKIDLVGLANEATHRAIRLNALDYLSRPDGRAINGFF